LLNQEFPLPLDIVQHNKHSEGGEHHNKESNRNNGRYKSGSVVIHDQSPPKKDRNSYAVKRVCTQS
jgi:hypothetical protein